MSALRMKDIDQLHVELCMGQKIRDITKFYDCKAYLVEKRIVMQRWADEILRLVPPTLLLTDQREGVAAKDDTPFEYPNTGRNARIIAMADEGKSLAEISAAL